MQIKKYSAPSLREATLLMKSELGDEALILGSKVIEEDNGVKRLYEITVGYDKPLSQSKIVKNEIRTNNNDNYAREIEILNEKINARASGYSLPAKHIPLQAKQKAPAYDLQLEEELKEVVNTLIQMEVQKSVISVILNQLKQYGNLLNTNNLEQYLISSISSMIPTRSFDLVKNKDTKVVAVVGPTGVGKTTCIAKLAVIAKLLHKLDVGLITIDTYRLGAIDQLRIFSEVSDIDMLVAYEPEEMKSVLKSFRKKDLVFIDTAGRSQKRNDQLNKTKSFLDEVKVDETFLVLNSTSSIKHLFDTTEKFKVLDYNSVIFTKTDESIAFGNIINLTSNFNIPVSFISNGQVIPDDIVIAEPELISKMIYTGKIN